MRDAESIFCGSAVTSGGFVGDIFEGADSFRVPVYQVRRTDVAPVRNFNRTLRK